jgi:hypothetical protein
LLTRGGLVCDFYFHQIAMEKVTLQSHRVKRPQSAFFGGAQMSLLARDTAPAEIAKTSRFEKTVHAPGVEDTAQPSLGFAGHRTYPLSGRDGYLKDFGTLREGQLHSGDQQNTSELDPVTTRVIQ